MRNEELLDALPLLVDCDGGIERLRGMILDLAVRGMLTSREPFDEPAQQLVERALQEKERLIGELGMRRPKAPPAIAEPPVPLPSGWAWAQLDWLGVVSPKNPGVDDDEAAGFVPMEQIPTSMAATHGHEVRAWSSIRKSYTHVADGDVAVAKITPCFQNGKSVVFERLPGGVGAATTELHVLRPTGGANARFILALLKSPQFINGGVPEMTGTAGQQRVPRDYFSGTAIALPPVEEQARIVEMVDGLLSLCDELEGSMAKALAAREHFADGLVEAVVAQAAAG